MFSSHPPNHPQCGSAVGSLSRYCSWPVTRWPPAMPHPIGFNGTPRFARLLHVVATFGPSVLASVEARPNSKPPGPRSASVHVAQCGPGASLSVPLHIQRWAPFSTATQSMAISFQPRLTRNAGLTVMRTLANLFSLSSVMLMAGCLDFSSSPPEVLYSYREVGQCKNGYMGEEHTPTKHIDRCFGLLTTKATLRVNADSQTVTYIEEDQEFNKEFEIKSTTVSKLKNCKVIDKNNFDCDHLVRTDGKFQLTTSFGERYLSSSWFCYRYARFGKGWLEIGTLEFHESAWSTAMYSVVAVVAFFGIAGVLSS